MGYNTPLIAKTAPISGTLCIQSLRDKRAILQAKRDGVLLIPRQLTAFLHR